MKKNQLVTILLFATLTSLPTFSQIQIQSEGQTKSFSEKKKDRTFIHEYDDGYYFQLPDYKCQKYNLSGDRFILKLFLGKNVQEIQQSIDIIQKWFNEAKNEAFIYVNNPDGQRICIYKYNSNMYISSGNETDCKQTRLQIVADATSALAKSSTTSQKERDEIMANIEFGEYVLTNACSLKEFIKSFENFKKNNQK